MKKHPFHLLLIALYPVISLYALNVGEAKLVEIVRPLLASIIIAGLLWALFRVIFKNSAKAAILASALFLVFSSYGAFYSIARNWKIGSLSLGRHRLLMIFLIIVLAAIIWWMTRVKDKSLASIIQASNYCSIVLIAFPLITLITHASDIHWPVFSKMAADASVEQTSANPDVYYFILDSYARADYISQDMHYDNSKFIDELHKRGFYTVDCGLSNYSFTRLSVATSLNMDYIEKLGSIYNPGNKDKTSIDPLILNNRVDKEFKDHGYQTVALETGFPFTEITASDDYFVSDPQILTKPYITSFEEMTINNTALSLALDVPSIRHALGLDFPYYERWLRAHFIIEKVKEVPEIKAPTFTFVHLLTTHRPYMFASDGGIQTDRHFYANDGLPVNDDYYIKGYQNGLDYTNAFMLDVVDTLIKNSKTPPIIILQGDHGVRNPGRDTILNAIYIPGGDKALYPTMTPVNTFRVVLNHLFNENLPLLEDRSNFSVADDAPFEFTKVDNSNSCKIQ